MASEGVDQEGELEKEPSINSDDPNERKLARRMRIKRRLETAERLQLIAEGKYEEPEPEKPLIDETIETCEDTLRQLYLEGRELVSNIMIASDSKEVERREIEEEERNARMEKLKEESSLALEKLNEISCKWETILDSSGPLELYQHMKDQKARCLELIEQKNDLIKSFQKELKMGDEKFMKDRKRMYEELALLTKRIDEQVLLMKKAYRIELEHIEESVDVTRTQIVEKHMKTWQNLYNQREKDETTNMERKFNMVENFHEELHKLHVDHEEKFRETRIQLETDIQTLEQELEQVKALCLLNNEKLDYNYQVLKKREEENVYIKNHQKRRLNKLQDMVNTLKKKIDEKRQSTDEEFSKLTKEVERYHANVLDTERKAEHFSKVNDEKFQSIWDMKDEEATDLVDKILSADMVIHEQILGLTWSPPPTTTINKMDLPSYKAAVAFVNDLKQRYEKPQSSKDVIETGLSVEVTEGNKRLLRHIFELIADQSGFLMEEKLDELLQPYSEDERTFVRLDNVFVAIGIQTEKDIETLKKMFLPYTVCLFCERNQGSDMSLDVRGDSSEVYVRSGIGSRQHSVLQIRELEEKVSKLRLQAKAEMGDESNEGSVKRPTQAGSEHQRQSEDIKQDSFEHRTEGSATTKRDQRHSLRGSHDAGTKSSNDQGPGVPECNITHPLIIEKHNVLKALKDFVSVFHSDRCRALLGLEAKLDKKRFTVSRLLAKDDIITYWEKYKDLLPPKLENVWNGIFLALTRYLTILQERHQLNTKAQAIRRQNLELKRLLAFYRKGKGHDEFTLPVISSVPDEPIGPEELVALAKKLAF